jgi:L-asparaginase
VLLIYTGGTMGMTMQNGSLAPARGYLPERIREMPEVFDGTMPELDILEYDPLIDSSNVVPEDWAKLAAHVRDNYYDYDGFVIVHGTDTMAYTASALSFMLEGLGKAVVITGSMIPLSAVYNDARRNLLISIIFAAQLELCEVVLFFNDHLLRGNRAVKVDSNGLDAFDSPNFPPLATVGAKISADRSIWRAPPISRLRVHTRLVTSVVVLHLVPGFDDSAILSMIRHSAGLRGLVLSLYGTGNGPSRKAGFLRTIAEAVEQGILVVAASQCAKGTVNLETYEVGKQLLDLGVISAGDMTTEAVVTKMAYLFGRDLKGAALAKAMQDDLRGERSVQPGAGQFGMRQSALDSDSISTFLGQDRYKSRDSRL